MILILILRKPTDLFLKIKFFKSSFGIRQINSQNSEIQDLSNKEINIINFK